MLEPKRTRISNLLCAVLLFLIGAMLTGPVFAETVPTTIHYQGRLTDNTPLQTPLNATIPIVFKIYDSQVGGTLLWSETWAGVPTSDGIFDVVLGSNGNPIPASVFGGNVQRYLEIIAVGEILAPRQRIGSVANALQTGRVGGIPAADIEALAIPAGAVRFFDRVSCPAGWTEFAPAGGRAVFALPSGGTASGTVGVAFTDQENRQHTHQVGSLGVATSSDGDHNHSADLVTSVLPDSHGHTFTYGTGTFSIGSHTHLGALPSSTSTTESHAHLWDPDASTGTESHNHDWSYWNSDSHLWRTRDQNGSYFTLVDWTDGLDDGGSGHYPLQADLTGAGSFYTTYTGHNHFFNASPSYTDSAELHQHSVNFPSYTSGSSGSHSHSVPASPQETPTASHAHTVPVIGVSSNTVAAHSHTGSTGALETEPGVTSAVMPYIQLLACRKD